MLSQYKTMFKSKGINGCQFLDLDRRTLASHIGVTSEAHQTKILEIIEGRTFVSHIIHLFMQ